MPNKLWNFSLSKGLLIPTGLIVGIKDGASYDNDWIRFTDADGRWLKGTDADGSVGGLGSRSSLSVGSGSGGAHVGVQSPDIRERAWSGKVCNDECYSTSNDNTNQGNHSGHTVNVNYIPKACKLKLIQAVADTNLPLGAIMFGDSANSDQTLFTTFTSHGGYLKADTATGVANAAQSFGSIGSVSDYHDHEQSLYMNAWGVATSYTSITSGGGSHNHAGSSLSVSENLARCAMRAFEIIEERKIEGLIGMWASPGTPDGWSTVANMTDRFLRFAATGDGSTAGNNTVSFSGSLGNTSHSHTPSGSSWGDVTGIPHSASISHSHTFSKSGHSYQPERYLIKFVRFDG